MHYVVDMIKYTGNEKKKNSTGEYTTGKLNKLLVMIRCGKKGRKNAVQTYWKHNAGTRSYV